MAAMVAGAAFALEFSTGVNMGGTIANYDGTEFQAFKFGGNDTWWNPGYYITLESGKVGANLALGFHGEVKVDYASIWFKPIDQLKFALDTNVGVNAGSIYFTKMSGTGDANGRVAGDWGYKPVTFQVVLTPIDGLTVEADFAPESGAYLWNFNTQTLNGAILGKIGYGADWGSVAVVVDQDASKFKAGLGFTGKFVDNLTIYVDAANADIDFSADSPSLDGINVGGGLRYVANGIDAAFYVPVYIPVAEGQKLKLGAKAYFGYTLDGPVTPFISFESADFMADSLTVKVTPGIYGNWNGLSYTVAAVLTISDTFKVEVPFSLSVGL